MAAPASLPLSLNSSWMYLPNRLELSLRTVRALPKASRMGFDLRTLFSIVPSLLPSPAALPRMARYYTSEG